MVAAFTKCLGVIFFINVVEFSTSELGNLTLILLFGHNLLLPVPECILYLELYDIFLRFCSCPSPFI